MGSGRKNWATLLFSWMEEGTILQGGGTCFSVAQAGTEKPSAHIPGSYGPEAMVHGARETTQLLRANAALTEDLSFGSCIPYQLSNNYLCNSNARGPNAPFWPLKASVYACAHTHTHIQNTHNTHTIHTQYIYIHTQRRVNLNTCVFNAFKLSVCELWHTPVISAHRGLRQKD